MRERILALHGGTVLKRSALNIRGGAGVFERVLAGQGYGTVLEIGTYRGVSAAEMSQYVERVISIDLLHGKIESTGEQFSRASFWKSLGVAEKIQLRLIKNDEEKAAFIAGVEFDFAFIDGAHDASVANDFAMVKRCGRVLFHDYDRRGRPEQDCVFDFVNTLPKEQVEVMDIFAYWRAPC